VTAAQGQNGVCAANGPEHARLLATGTNDGFAACLDNAGADKEVLRTELRISHSFPVVIEVVGFDAELLK
jgi:hypothetical protein